MKKKDKVEYFSVIEVKQGDREHIKGSRLLSTLLFNEFWHQMYRDNLFI